MKVIEKVFNWQKDLPDWQSDLLRRLLFKEDTSDVDSLYANLKIEEGLSVGVSKSTKLTESDLPTFDTVTSKVVLLKVSSLKNINAIKDDEQISFSPEGVTVIYGENGTGKSGYSRLLKKACRSRDRHEKIHGNAFQESKNEKSAHFDYKNGDSAKSYEWKLVNPPDESLSNIAVFDSSCARITVNEKTEIAYVPYGADVFQAFGEIIARLKKKLESEKKAFPKRPAEFENLSGNQLIKESLSLLEGASDIGVILAKTKLSEDEAKELETLSAIVDVEKSKLLSKQIETKVSEINRIDFFRKSIDDLNTQLSKDTIDELATLWTEARDARKVATEVVKGFEKLKGLNGIGTETWKTLFIAASEYSTEFVYKGKAFPNLEDEAACVLCYQPLSVEAKNRFKDFKSFLENKAEVEASKKKQTFVDALSKYKSNEIEVLKNYSDVENLMGGRTPGWKEEFQVFLTECEQKRKAILETARTGNWGSISSGPAFETKPISDFHQQEKQQLKKKSDALAEGNSAKNIARHQLLFAKNVINNNSAYYADYISSRKHNSFVDLIAKKINTRRISDFAAEIISESVTEEFRSRLQAEFDVLLANQLNVELKQTTQQGKTSYYLTLNLPGIEKVSPCEILSEGEQKVVAVASFLAEISSFGHQSGIVFDDPVSSLDQRWKVRIAKRLAEEGKQRQVIVFTHDIGFAMELQKYCGEKHVSHQLNSLTKIGRQAGIRETEFPWPLLEVKKRIGILKNEHQLLEKVHRTEGEVRYKNRIGDVYSRIRSTWERSFEECVLNQSIMRFRSGIETSRLKEVCIPKEFYEPILIGMTRCSDITDAHDEASDRGNSTPTPPELLSDILELEKFVSLVNKNREKIRKENEIKPINAHP